MSKTQKIVAINYSQLVDRLGELNAAVAPLHDEIEQIKATLRSSGFEAVEGKTFRVTIGETTDQAYVNWQEIAKFAISNARLQRILPDFTDYKPKLGPVRCVAKVR